MRWQVFPEHGTPTAASAKEKELQGNSTVLLYGFLLLLTRLMSLSSSFSRCHFLHLSSNPCVFQTMTLTSQPKAGEQAIYYKPQIKLPAVMVEFFVGGEAFADQDQLCVSWCSVSCGGQEDPFSNATVATDLLGGCRQVTVRSTSGSPL